MQYTLENACNMAWSIFVAKPSVGVDKSAEQALKRLSLPDTDENRGIVSGAVIETVLGLDNFDDALAVYGACCVALAANNPTIERDGLPLPTAQSASIARHYLGRYAR